LRAPLRSIDGFSLALLEDYNDKLDSNGRDYLNRVRNSAQRMSVLIDDLLELSRVTRSEINREIVELSALASGVTKELATGEPERKVAIQVAEGVTAEGDKRLLKVVLDNLLGNAWKYTGKTDKAEIEFGVIDKGGRAAYYVRDNGAGFDMKYADKLFGAFQRLHKAEEFPGTGIGLATVQRIVHRHGGQVWAEGKPGGGATFFFSLNTGVGGDNGE
jgi:light-regulated signal transduction histidine kinase (bacteriophytochrome)